MEKPNDQIGLYCDDGEAEDGEVNESSQDEVRNMVEVEQLQEVGASGNSEEASTAILERLQGQIHYYFSDQNLNRDRFLLSQHDEDGYVDLSIIAAFPKIDVMLICML